VDKKELELEYQKYMMQNDIELIKIQQSISLVEIERRNKIDNRKRKIDIIINERD
jgi:hypothetical protein